MAHSSVKPVIKTLPKEIIMKTTNRTIFIATLIAIASLSHTVMAQTLEHSMKVRVPFAFNYGKQHFTAGVYTVSMENQNVLRLRSGRLSGWVMIETGYDPTQHKSGYVAFRKYGDQYFLTEYVPTSGAIRASVFASGAERRAARDFAANHVAPSRVELALMTNIGSGEPLK
jgi:hypothetical protein